MFEAMQLFGGGAGGGAGTSISPDNSMKGHSESSGVFGDHSVGLGGNWKSLAILAAGAVLFALVWRGGK